MPPSVDLRSNQNLGVSFLAFTVCFAIRSIFSIFRLGIKQPLGLDDPELDLKVARTIRSGSLNHAAFGVWTDRIGGRPLSRSAMLARGVAPSTALRRPA
jgi:NNP family nitrate/nitrite transporter-like MFS transporter